MNSKKHPKVWIFHTFVSSFSLFFVIAYIDKSRFGQGIKKDTRFSLVSQTVDKVILRQRKGLGNKLFITLLRKAGFACRPFLGGK